MKPTRCISKHCGRVIRFALFLFLTFFLYSALAEIYPLTADVYLFASHFDPVPPPGAVKAKDVSADCPGTAPGMLDLGNHMSALAPDGSVYIADWTDDVILKRSEDCGSLSVVRVAGDGTRGIATSLPAVATQVPLDGPYGVDVAADGTVYFAEWQPSELCGAPPGRCYANKSTPPHDAGRILRLDADGMLHHVADVPAPAKVKLSREEKLYVASKNGQGSGGVWEVDLGTGTATEIVPDVDAEGLALFETVTSGERWLYVPVQIPTDTFGHWEDAYVCRVDLNNPGLGCSVILRDSMYGESEGPDLLELWCDNCGPEGGPWPNGVSRTRVNDVEVDSSGMLQLLYSYEDPSHMFVNCPPLNRAVIWGGNLPLVYRWHPNDTDAEIHFGRTHMEGEEIGATWLPDEALATYPDDPDPQSVIGTEAALFYGYSIGIGADHGLLLSDRDATLGLDSTCSNTNPLSTAFRTYEIRNVVPGSRLFLGSDVASFEFDNISNPPGSHSTDDVVIDGTAYFEYDAQNERVSKVYMWGTYPGEGGTAYVAVNLTHGGALPNFFSGSVWINDPGEFVHIGDIVVVLSPAHVQEDGNDVEVMAVSTDAITQDFFEIKIKLRDGLQ